MPTFRHGKGAAFKLDNSSGVLTDLSNVLNEIGFPREVETGETTSFGQNSKTYVVGLSDSTFSLSGTWDATVDTTINGAIAALQTGTQASLSFEYGPEGTTSGRKKYSGECIIKSYEVSSPVGDVVTFSLEAQNTGDVTVGTWA